MRPISIRGKALSTSGPALICVPLVAPTADGLLTEIAALLPGRPDAFEWRVDFFKGIGSPLKVVEVAKRIRQTAGNIPVIFTRRSMHEGGEKTGLAEDAVADLYELVCASSAVDIIDCELSQPAAFRARLREASRAHDVAMILSYHQFVATPSGETLTGKFIEAERAGADIAKVAVMPESAADVLVLLDATLKASRQAGIPLIAISMGGLGAMSRVCGWMYGSALTFAAGQQRSAPGQMPIDELRAAMTIMQRAVSGE